MQVPNIYNSFFPKINFKNKVSILCLPKDTVSFSGKINVNYEMKKLPIEAFPSEALREYMLQSLSQNPQADILELHRQYYSLLLSCESLSEAKELYPEFEKVLDAKELNLSKKPPNNVFCQIAKGQIEGFDIETVSLVMLQKYYAELIPVSNDYIKENFNMAYSAFNTLIDTLNISMDKRYFKLLGLKMRAQNMQKAWKNPDLKEKRAKTFQKTLLETDYREKISRISKERWQNPQYREVMTSKIRQIRQSPEAREKTAQITKKLWQDEDYCKKMKINNIAAALAWESHPYAKNVYKQIALEFPELKMALERRRAKQPLTERQKRIVSTYYKECVERYPELKKELGQIQKSILTSWGFYDEGVDYDKLLEYAESLQDKN